MQKKILKNLKKRVMILSYLETLEIGHNRY